VVAGCPFPFLQKLQVIDVPKERPGVSVSAAIRLHAGTVPSSRSGGSGDPRFGRSMGFLSGIETWSDAMNATPARDCLE
jgi:hypothetical protein